MITAALHRAVLTATQIARTHQVQRDRAAATATATAPTTSTRDFSSGLRAEAEIRESAARRVADGRLADEQERRSLAEGKLLQAERKIAQLERDLADRNQRLAAIGAVCHVDVMVSAAKVVITRRAPATRPLPGLATRRLAAGTGEHETDRPGLDDFDFEGDTVQDIR